LSTTVRNATLEEMKKIISTLLFFHCGFVNAQEFIGDPTGQSGIYDTRLGRALTSGSLHFQIKSEEQVAQYFQCFLTTEVPRGRLRRYQETVGLYTQWASETMQVPRTLSSCMMFRESMFDNSAVSGAGAISMAQIKPDTYSHIRDDIIATINEKRMEDEYLQRLANGGPNFNEITPAQNVPENKYVVCAQFSQRDGPYYNQADSQEREKSHNDCRDWMIKFSYRKKLLDSYQFYMAYAYRNLSRRDPALARSYFPNMRPGQTPTYEQLIPPADPASIVNNPILMVGIQMYYLKELMFRMDHRMPSGQITERDANGYLMLMAGGYNAGDNALLNSMNTGNSVEQWCRNLSNPETRNYMLSVRRCITSNDLTGPRDPNGANGDLQSSTCNRSSYTATDDPCTPPRVVPELRPRSRPERSEPGLIDR
jgi:hypothetical protein